MRLNEKVRDDEGRSHLAPAWSGDINALSADQLHHRIEALGSHIGRLSTIYVGDGRWTKTLDLADVVRPWVDLRLACLRRLDELQPMAADWRSA